MILINERKLRNNVTVHFVHYIISILYPITACMQNASQFGASVHFQSLVANNDARTKHIYPLLATRVMEYLI